jgi:O-acetyl-ADP-ribose deacetylase (regulator of RNase III)
MGKGIALQFRKAYPDNYKAYKKACEQGKVQPGHMFVFFCGFAATPRYIINFPTKRHWRNKSNIEDIRSGLQALVNEVRKLDIKSIAIPPLGCGLGGLCWDEVKELMRSAFDQIPQVRWLIYEPNKIDEKKATSLSARPRMTPGRSLIIGLIEHYLVPGFVYEITLTEIQKLVYFLVESGEVLNKIKFEKGHYGPYSNVLHHVLERLNGHFIHGLSSKKPNASITVEPSILHEAREYLNGNLKTRKHFDKVTQLVEGFETPFGMELLATVHWVATRDTQNSPLAAYEILQKIHNWNTRKAKIMDLEHVELALNRLVNQGWL